ncbi:MAG: AraC family transcriptional regulator [Lentisphaeria bacterium]
MISSTKADFIHLLKRIRGLLPLKNFFCGKSLPHPENSELVEAYPFDVFDIPLSGKKDIAFAQNENCISPVLLSPGDVLFSPAGVWKKPLWRKEHELCCLIFRKDYIRMTYITFIKPTILGIRPTVREFYHLKSPVMKNIIQLLQITKQESKNPEVGKALFAALLEITLNLLEQDCTTPPGKAQKTYLTLHTFLEENFTDSTLTREKTAKIFKLNPSYISRLFLRFGVGFNETLRELRFDYAQWLLLNTDLLTDEIVARCGYCSSNSFSITFKKIFGVPPARFRILNQPHKLKIV